MSYKSNGVFYCTKCNKHLGSAFDDSECSVETKKTRRTRTFGTYGGSKWAPAIKKDLMDFSEISMEDSAKQMMEE